MSWSEVASRGRLGDSGDGIGHQKNDGGVCGPGDGGGGRQKAASGARDGSLPRRSSTQLGLLHEALKSREDAVSGARWCLGCGKKFMDVFKLAQHIKDRHRGVNGPDRAGGGEGGGHGEGRAVHMGDYIGAVPKDTKGMQQRSARVSRSSAQQMNQAGANGVNGVEGVEGGRRGGLQRFEDVGESRKKPMSSLKKKYVREKRRAMRAVWDGVRASLDENIREVEVAWEGFVTEIDVGCDGVDWWSMEGQVRWYQGYLAGRCLEELRAMRVLCMRKLEALEAEQERVGMGRKEGNVHVKGGEGVSEWTQGKTEEEATRDQEVEEVEEERVVEEVEEMEVQEDEVAEGNEGQEGEEEVASLYDSYSDDSDESFDLQWGDTLQTWAHSLGHASLKSLSRAEEETLGHQQEAPVVLDVVELPASKGQGRRHDGTGGVGDAGHVGDDTRETDGRTVRVVIHADPSDKDGGKGRHGEELIKRGSIEQGESVALVEQAISTQDPVVPWHEEFLAFNTACPPIYCAVCDGLRVFAWDVHLSSPEHGRRLATLARRQGSALPISGSTTHLTKKHNLSVEPKRYVGTVADVEAYVTHVITDELNNKVVALLSKLIAWQARTKEMDPMNAKKKRRLVSGMREVAKAVRLGKVCGLIVAPNVQPLSEDDHTRHKDNDQNDQNDQNDGSVDGSKAISYPIDGILQDACTHGVPTVFALTRRKLGKLLGQKKTVSLFALLNVQGAEQEFADVLSLVNKK